MNPPVYQKYSFCEVHNKALNRVLRFLSRFGMDRPVARFAGLFIEKGVCLKGGSMHDRFGNRISESDG